MGKKALKEKIKKAKIKRKTISSESYVRGGDLSTANKAVKVTFQSFAK